MDSLPPELVVKILLFTPIDDILLSFQLTCSDWQNASMSAFRRRRRFLDISSFQRLCRHASDERYFKNKERWLYQLLRHLLPMFEDCVDGIRFDNLPLRNAFMLMNGVNSGETSPWTITTDIMKLIQQFCPNVRELDFRVAIFEFMAYRDVCAFTNLRRLVIHDVPDRFDEVLEALEKLRFLTISGTDAPLSWSRSENIRELCVRQPTPNAYLRIIGQDFSFQDFVENFPNLRVHLDARVGPVIIAPVMRSGLQGPYRRLTKLTSSTVMNYFCTYGNWWPPDVSAFTNIRSLMIKVTTGNERLLYQIATFPRLTDLRLWTRRPIGPSELKAVFAVPTLKRLQIRDFDFSIAYNVQTNHPVGFCHRLKVLRIWAAEAVHLCKAADILYEVIKRCSCSLEVLQLLPGTVRDTKELEKFTMKMYDALWMDKLTHLEMPFFNYPRCNDELPQMDNMYLLPDDSIFTIKRYSIRTLAFDIDGTLLKWLSELQMSGASNLQWMEVFPNLTSLTFRQLTRSRDAGVGGSIPGINMEGFLINCPKLKEFFIDWPCPLSEPLFNAIGSHRALERITITHVKIDCLKSMNDRLEDRFRLLMDKRLAITQRLGYRLPVMQLNISEFNYAEATIDDLFSVGVILSN